MTMKNNNGLVSKAIAGDKAAFEELYNEYSDKVYFFALRNVGSEDAARDITSETFANAFESIGTLQSEKSFSNWLFSIAYKKCIDHLRVINKNDYYEDSEQLEKLIEYTALDEPVMLPDDYAANKETAEQLKAVVDGMPASLRSAVLLYYYEDMPVSEVAKTLGISENHAKNKLFRARKLLRKKLEKLIGNGAVFAAVPMRNIFHSAFSEPYVKGAVAGGAKVKSFGLAARLAVVGMSSAIAVGVPMMIPKSSGGDYRPEDNNAPQIISESIAESETSSFPENSDLKIIRTADPDAIFYDIDELIQEADVIMIGEYLEEGRSTNGMTFNTLKAIKVFKGEDKLENGTLPIYECYAYSTTPEGNKELRLDTCYVPMHKGDKAIFVLGYNEYQKSYGPFEYEGRFPLPEDVGKKDDLGFTNGVLKEEQFNKEIYDQLLERFNISEEDNYSRGDKMKKQILVLTAAMLMTGCTESSESTENNAAFSYGDVTSAQSCDSEKRYEHFKIIDGAVETVETNTICKMRLVFDTVDYLSGVDKIGNELLGEKYNKAKWNIYEHRPDPDSDFTIRDGQYSDNRFGGLFLASDNAIFVYAPKMFDTTAPGSFGDKITDIREGFFKDKNTTLESVKAQAEKLIWLFDDSIGAEHSTISGIYYHTDKDVIEFDFKQTINEIEISSVPYTLCSYSYDIYSEELKRSQGLGRKSVFVNSNEDYYIDINSPHIAAEPTEKYDEIITLDSALEYLDNNLAVNLNYDMVGAELKYLAVTESTDSEKNTAALPVWEFQLINHTEKQRYVCQINAVSGESSFVKVKGAVE